MLLLFSRLAFALSLSYDDALNQAAAQAPGVRLAGTEVDRASGALLAARSPYEPSLSASGSAFGSTDENAVFAGQTALSKVGGWSYALGLGQGFSTGTSVGLDFSASTQRYSVFEFDEELFDFAVPEATYSTDLSLRISQALLQGNRMAYNLQGVSAANRGVTAAEVSREEARQEALAAAARGYWALWQAHELVGIAKQTLDLVKEQARVVNALVADGRLAPVEGTRIAAAVAQAERGVLEAETGEAAARDVLLQLMGEKPGTELTLTSLPAQAARVNLDGNAVVEGVLAGNLQLRAARLTAEGAADTAKYARHTLLPALGVTGTYGVSGYEETMQQSLKELSTGDLRQWTLGGEVSVPLANRADRGSLGQYEASAEAARLNVESLERSLAAETLAAVRTVENAARNVELSALNLRLAEETLAAENARFREGRSLQKDVLQASKDRETARVELGEAETGYAVALVELERLRGGL